MKSMNNRECSWYRKSLKGSNQYCLYCGRYIGEGSGIESNKEHLIAREFVPKGTYSEHDFNFTFRACTEHNNEKSKYERHVSSITMLDSIGPETEEEIRNMAIHKANNDYHPSKKGIKIADSQEKLDIKWGGENFSISFSFIAPPQLDEVYVKYLAFMQMQGFFALISSPQPYNGAKLMLLSGQYFQFLGAWRRSDWGNVILGHLARLVADWKCYANIDSGRSYYRAIIKIDPLSKIWFWAFEWNKSYRVAGFVGDIETTQEFVKNIPVEEWAILEQENGRIIRTKNELTLSSKDDGLFQGDVE